MSEINWKLQDTHIFWPKIKQATWNAWIDENVCFKVIKSPNWFQRKMISLFFGVRWEKINARL